MVTVVFEIPDGLHSESYVDFIPSQIPNHTNLASVRSLSLFISPLTVLRKLLSIQCVLTSIPTRLTVLQDLPPPLTILSPLLARHPVHLIRPILMTGPRAVIVPWLIQPRFQSLIGEQATESVM